jgi:hypothetical protein
MLDWILIVLLGSGSNDDAKLKIVPKPIPSATAEPLVPQDPMQDRLTMLSEAAGVTVPVVVGYCGERKTILGCYDTVDNYIIITESGMQKNDNKIICVLQHEMRHKWQNDNGLIKFDSKGRITNKDWIEKDARENGCA